MIPILKLMLAVATVLGVVVTTINCTPKKGQKSGNQKSDKSVEDPHRINAQKALDAIGSKLNLTGSQERAKRGQHVFNNGLLGFHRSVLQDLLKDVGGYHEQLNNLVQDLMIPLNNDQRELIGTTMVVYFSLSEPYVDFNAEVYGEYTRELRKALVAYLKAYTSDSDAERYRIHEKRSQVQFIATNMVTHTVYVDPMARDHWLNEKKKQTNRQQLYNEVKDAVKNMFQIMLQAFIKVSEKIKAFRERRNWNR